MTDEVDAGGYFVLERHAVVTLAREGVSAINCADFDMVPGIIFRVAGQDAEVTASSG